MTEAEIRLTDRRGDIAALGWDRAAVDPSALIGLLGAAAAGAFEDGIRRLEVVLPADDPDGRRSLFRSGFRLEGRRRLAVTGRDGGLVDELIFARLSDDVVSGPLGFSSVANSLTPRKRLIAHVLIRDDRDRVLLCDTTFKADWELPGGIVEPGEAPHRAAIREVREELGVDIRPGRLLAIDWMPPYLGWEDACELIFDGGRITEHDLTGFTLDPQEIERAMLVSLAEAHDHLIGVSYRRLSAILDADPDSTLVLENGTPVP